MQATFQKRDTEWVIRSEKYLKSGSRVEVKRRDGSVSVVVVGDNLESPRGVQRKGDYVYRVAK